MLGNVGVDLLEVRADFLPNQITARDPAGKVNQWSALQLCLPLVVLHIYPRERIQGKAFGSEVFEGHFSWC